MAPGSPAPRLAALALSVLAACGGQPSDSGAADSDTPTIAAVDADQDGSPASEDCDDDDPAVHPDADELCNGVDDDCDDQLDEDDAVDASTWYADADADGFGDLASPATACAEPTDHVADSTDCDDADPTAFPGGTEVCGGGDEDCDGTVDEDGAQGATTWFLDDDGDGAGDPADSVVACDAPTGRVADAGDCDDDDASHHPDADETCDGDDDDCDTLVDEDDATDAPTWYADLDSDGFGDPGAGAPACAQPSSTVADDTDCDDTDASHNPDAPEACDGDDDDCDGTVDEAGAVDASTWYADTDSDGFGDASAATVACDAPLRTVADASDCDDADASHNPDAPELCDGDDDDCDGATDESTAVDAGTWYADTDGDGFGDPATGTPACEAPTGTVADATDCDDGSADHNPDAEETCDGDDDDCDGDTDESGAVDAATWYADTDGDGFGDSSSPQLACEAPTGTATSATDCDDGDAEINPDAEEHCWATDDFDCDGASGSDDSDCVPAGTSAVSAIDGGVGGPGSDAYSGTALVARGDTSGDGLDDLIVTAPGYGSGTAWVHHGSADIATRSLSRVYAASTLSGDDSLGAAAAFGDVDGDGLADILLGDTDLSSSSGGAYLFHGVATGLGSVGTSSAAWQVTTSGSADQLGAALASGDLDGDGLADVAVGAPRADSDPATDSGAVYVFAGPLTGSVDVADATRTLRGELQGDEAGATVAILPDLDGDGLDELVIGSPGRDWLEEDAGGVTLWTDAPTGGDARMTEAEVWLRGAVQDDGFGTAFAGGDVDGDGHGDLFVGVPGDDTTASGAGAALLFHGPLAPGLRLDAASADVTVLGEAGNDDAGEALATGDVDGDGYVDLLIGGGDHDQGGSDAGAVWMLLGPVTDAVVDLTAADWELEGYAGESLGSALATGDLDGDGHDDVVAGAPQYSGTYSRSGRFALVLGGGRVETAHTPSAPDFADDADGDGYSEDDGDCDDTRSAVGPGATETCGDDRDDDCDGWDAGCALSGTITSDDAWFAVHGPRSNATGTALARAVDLNDDGWHDLVVGADGHDLVAIWFGPVPQGPARTESPDLLIEGVANSGLGAALAVADFDGDGVDDLAMGAPDSDDTFANGGAVFVLLGAADLTGTLSMPDDADFVFSPEAEEHGLGIEIAGGTDLDGDGVEDLLLGAMLADGRDHGEGGAYLILGGRAAGEWSVSTADHALFGESFSDAAGESVDFAGDLDGDGHQDLIIGAPDQVQDNGAAYLAFGPFTDTIIDLASVRGRFVGGNYAGSEVRGVGDLDGDGFDDLAISVPGYDSSASDPGSVHVWFGPLASAWHDTDQADLIIDGVHDGDEFGLAVATAGDVDQDGYADLLIGTAQDDTIWPDTGSAWLFYGPLSAGTLDTTNADAALEGYYGGRFGTAVAFAGDLDGDGHGDVAIGAPDTRISTWSWVNYTSAGAAFVYRGGDRGVSVHTPPTLSLTDDADGDGWTETDGDCDDTDATISPDAAEVCENQRDDDCDGVDRWCVPSGSISLGDHTLFEGASNYEHGTGTALRDLDGDGFDDLVVGMRSGRTGEKNGGEATLMWGPLQLGEVDWGTSRTPDVDLYGTTNGDYVGGDVWTVDDVDGDGLAELLIGADGAVGSGAVYLVTDAANLGAEQDISTVATTTWEGVASGDGFGSRLSGGDLDGDGVVDLVATAPGSDDGETDAGVAYIFYGPVTAGTVSAVDADAWIVADTYLAGLEAIEITGDTDGDGVDDLLLGAPDHEGAHGTWGTGAAWLWRGGTLAGELDTDSADAVFEAEASGDGAGTDVAAAGDVDGDGLVDLLIGAETTTTTVSRAGTAYFFYGGPITGTVSLADADTRFLGTKSNGYAADGLGSAGDLDGDGDDEVLIGVPGSDTLYLFRAPFDSGDVDITASDADFYPWGETYAGQVGQPGDHDGDGLDDIVVAAPDIYGRVWVVPGGID